MVRKHTLTKYKYEFQASDAENLGVLYLMANKDLVCMVIFREEGEELSPPREGVNGLIYLVYPIKWLKDIIDMLRFEKPVYFTWDDSTHMARITTEEEPVGEEEHRSVFKFLFG